MKDKPFLTLMCLALVYVSGWVLPFDWGASILGLMGAGFVAVMDDSKPRRSYRVRRIK